MKMKKKKNLLVMIFAILKTFLSIIFKSSNKYIANIWFLPQLWPTFLCSELDTTCQWRA